MNKQVLTAAIAGMMMVASGSPALAAGLGAGGAYQDAEQALIDRRVVDENQIRQHGEEYTSAFLSAFAQLSQEYEQAFRQGVAAGIRGTMDGQVRSRVGQAGYQRGYQRGQQLRPQPNSPAVNDPAVLPAPAQPADPQSDQSAAPPAGEQSTPDQQEYPVRQPSPDQAKFIARIAKSAQKVGMEYDLYPSIIIAQAALESDWGTSGLARKPYHNLFGVKGAFNGRSVDQPTTEYTRDGREQRINDHFRWYENDYQSLCDYAETLADPLYAGVHRSQAKDYRAATHALLGKYATDPHYDRKLNKIIDSYQLTKYDEQTRTGHLGNVKTSQPKAAVAKLAHHPGRTAKENPHHLTWLSIIGGASSAGAFGLLRRFIVK